MWKEAVITHLKDHLHSPVKLLSTSPVSGGDINQAYRFETSEGNFFVKKNSASRYPKMFEKEANGLELIASTKTIPVPEVILFGEDNDVSFLVLNIIETSVQQPDFWQSFAERLARLHKQSTDYFGLDHDNFIGSLTQSNTPHKKWTDFFREERLHSQVKLARDNGRIGIEIVKSFDRFYGKLDEIFPVEAPALVHGDLWGGNFMVNEKGEAIIIDPAVYYGSREMDLAMSKLFGGFSSEFYKYYDNFFPLEKGWQQRIDFCNLYPLMVHVNLFGGGYQESVKSILRKF